LLPNLYSSLTDLDKGKIVYDLSQFTNLLIDAGQGNQEEKRFAFADTSFFEVFDLEFIHGVKEGVLSSPNNIVVTRSTAEKYFESSEKAIGKILKVNNNTEFMIAGVI
jgi:putative ABC transport system permease protein